MPTLSEMDGDVRVFILFASFAVIVVVVTYFSRSKRPSVPPGRDGPGRFRVHGVDRQTGEDVVREVEAASSANAKAKAELQGIAVTGVERA